MFCQETVEETRQVFDADPTYPPLLFIHPAETRKAREFFDEFWPEARAVSDPSRKFYDAFELKSGSLRELFGPGVWLKALQASRKGYSVRMPIGNVWLLPGMFFVEKAAIRWSWKYRNIADRPDMTSIPKILQGSH